MNFDNFLTNRSTALEKLIMQCKKLQLFAKYSGEKWNNEIGGRIFVSTCGAIEDNVL